MDEIKDKDDLEENIEQNEEETTEEETLEEEVSLGEEKEEETSVEETEEVVDEALEEEEEEGEKIAVNANLLEEYKKRKLAELEAQETTEETLEEESVEEIEETGETEEVVAEEEQETEEETVAEEETEEEEEEGEKIAVNANLLEEYKRKKLAELQAEEAQEEPTGEVDEEVAAEEEIVEEEAVEETEEVAVEETTPEEIEEQEEVAATVEETEQVEEETTEEVAQEEVLETEEEKEFREANLTREELEKKDREYREKQFKSDYIYKTQPTFEKVDIGIKPKAEPPKVAEQIDIFTAPAAPVEEEQVEVEETVETLMAAEAKAEEVKKAAKEKTLFEEVQEQVSEDEEGNIQIVRDYDESEEIPKAKTAASDDEDGEGEEGVIVKTIEEIMHDSMMPYTEHVILDRALPRVEDGLKPVQRRILYTMHELGLSSDKPFKKSARIVGDCLGKYHPHGDSSVYSAMVRMAQNFNMKEILVSGHGNFGSVDGDSAAAMRYTEARLAPLAEELLRDIEKETVKFSFNFDDTLKEPETLPGYFPNLLVNGASGIAVGLATNIPPHNLAEAIDACIAYINQKSITVKELMKIIRGPEFPTGGYIIDNGEIERAYETGKGKILMRARLHIEATTPEKQSIVITELPYQVNKAKLLVDIADLSEEAKGTPLGFIADIVDESDRRGTRAVIRLKKDAQPQKIVAELFKKTDLQKSFGINMVAIADGRPQQMGLLDILAYYTDYQREVVLARSKFEYNELKEREHILEGLIVAIKNIDEVIRIIKRSANTTEARQKLRERFKLSEKQAQAILDMRLARLTSLEVYKLEKELEEIKKRLQELTEIINSKRRQYDVVKAEMLAIKKQYKTDRKTVILATEEKYKIPSDLDEKPIVDVVIASSASGMIKKILLKNFNMTTKEFGASGSLNEVHTTMLKTDTTKTVYAFTNLGMCYKLQVANIPEVKFKDKGVALKKMVADASENEYVVKFVVDNDITGKDATNELWFFTKEGMVKRTYASEYGLLKVAFEAMKLREGDEIINIENVIPGEETSMFFVTKDGMSLYAEVTDVPLQGRISIGVKGIGLNDGDLCAYTGMHVGYVQKEMEILLVTNKGNAKRVKLNEWELSARHRKGVKILSPEPKEKIIFAGLYDAKATTTFVAQKVMLELASFAYKKVSVESRVSKGKPSVKVKAAEFLEAVYEYKTEL